MNDLKILIADDLDFMQMAYEGTLNYLKGKCMFVNNGKEAVEAVRTNDFDIVFMDIEMPVLSGIEATQKIRQELSFPKNQVPIIAVTAHDTDEFIDSLSNLGFTDHISKKLNKKALNDVIEKYALNKPENTETSAKKYHLNFSYTFDVVDDKLQRELVSYIVDNIPKFIEQLHTTLETKEWQKAKNLCHKLSNQFLYIGLYQAKQNADLIEKGKLEEMSSDEIMKIFQLIENDCNAAICEMKKDFEL